LHNIPKLTGPLDAIVRLTSTAICGSDLQIYRARIAMNITLTFKHGIISITEEVGSDVTTVKKGDRVVVTVSYAKKESNGEVVDAGSYGISDYGIPLPQINGGQVQYMRISFMNSSLLLVPSGRSLS
jgi:glutathione-independent formaldehyde dehydrogenase